jgi:hypothetical protein
MLTRQVSQASLMVKDPILPAVQRQFQPTKQLFKFLRTLDMHFRIGAATTQETEQA